MKKLADLSTFESLMGGNSSLNSVFNSPGNEWVDSDSPKYRSHGRKYSVIPLYPLLRTAYHAYKGAWHGLNKGFANGMAESEIGNALFQIRRNIGYLAGYGMPMNEAYAITKQAVRDAYAKISPPKRFLNSRSNQSSPDHDDRRKPADKPTKKRNKDRGLVTDRKKRIEALREVLPFAPKEVLEKMADSPTLDITVF